VRLLFASLLGLLAAIAAGILFNRDAGRVVLSFGEWTVQTTLSFFVVSIVLLFIAVYAIVRAALQLIRLPRDWTRWSAHRRRRRSEQFLMQGLDAMVEGDWRVAERAFRKGAAFSRKPAVNYLCAARAAQRQGAGGRRDHYLKLAREDGSGAALAVELARAGLQAGDRELNEAFAALLAIESAQPGNDRVRLALLDLAVRLRDWDEAGRLLGQVEAAKTLPAELLRGRQSTVHAGALRNAGATRNRERLEEQWRRIPAKLQREPRLIEAYVSERLRFADTADCEPLLRRALERHWDAGLVHLYGEVQGKDPERQLREAESWLERHDQDEVLLLALGRLCRRGGLWGKARGFLEESIRRRPLPEAFLELAALHEQQGDVAAASACSRDGLHLLAERPADGRNTNLVSRI
jgi:HemY protein